MINVGNNVIWTIFPYLYPCWAIDREKGNNLACSAAFYTVSAKPCGRATNSYLCRAFSCQVDPVQTVLILLIHLFYMLTILSPWKRNDCSVTLFVQTMICLDLFPCHVNTNILKHPTDCLAQVLCLK